MTRPKKSPPRKRSSTSRSTARSGGRFPRFLKALLFSSLASFGAATYVLNPQWRIPAPVQQALNQLQGKTVQVSKTATERPAETKEE